MRVLITILRVTDNIKTYLSALKLISNIYEGTNHRTRIQHWGVLLRDFFIEDFFMNTGKNVLQNIFCKTEWDTTMQFLVDNFFYLCSAKMVNQFFHAIHSRTASPLLLERFFFWRLTSSFFDAVWVYYWLFHLQTTFMTLSSHCPLHTFPFLVFWKLKFIRFMQQVSEMETSS